MKLYQAFEVISNKDTHSPDFVREAKEVVEDMQLKAEYMDKIVKTRNESMQSGGQLWMTHTDYPDDINKLISKYEKEKSKRDYWREL